MRAAGAGDADLRHAGLVDAGKDFDTVHGSVGDEDMLMCRVVGDAPVARFAWWIIQRGDGIGSYIGRARKAGGGGELHGERKRGGVRERSARALSGDGEVAGGGGGASAENDGDARAGRYAERACRICRDTRGQAAQRYLHGAAETVLRCDRHGDGRTRRGLRKRERIRGERNGEVGGRRRRRGLHVWRGTAATAAGAHEEEKSEDGFGDALSHSPPKFIPPT